MTKSIGRFAPTPSGPLHFGSLVAALGSYLIAKQNSGLWYLRIEDLDPPREQPGAADNIIKTLSAFGFEWDGEIVYQSQRQPLYQEALLSLESKGISYRCDCSRKTVQQRNNGIYDGFCRNRGIDPQMEAAVRVRFDTGFEQFEDQILGLCTFSSDADKQDFVVRRRDKLFAYQLAVVVDDIEQKIDHVVRGADILDSTPRQNFLYSCFQREEPTYYHLPLVVDKDGEKFSKSKLYPSIESHSASLLLVKALEHLNQSVEQDLSTGTPQEILKYALQNWQLEKVGKLPKTVSL